MSTNTERRSQYQLFVDMDGVLVDFEGGVLKYMNERFRELKDQPDHPDYKLAASTSKEIGGWDVEINKWHIARSDMEGSLKRNYRTRDFMYRLVENDVELWASLPWIDNGRQLWDHVKDLNPHILSAPMAEGSITGKRIWVEKNLGLSGEPVHISDNKGPFGVYKDKKGLLIDDRDKYINQFKSGGGETIKHAPSTLQNTIDELEKFGFVKE